MSGRGLLGAQEGWLCHLGNQVSRKQSWAKSPQSQVPQQPTASSETLLLKGSLTSTHHQPVGEPFTFKQWCSPKLQAWSRVVWGSPFCCCSWLGFCLEMLAECCFNLFYLFQGDGWVYHKPLWKGIPSQPAE